MSYKSDRIEYGHSVCHRGLVELNTGALCVIQDWVLVPWLAYRAGKAAYLYTGCHSGLIELSAGTLVVIHGW